MALAKKHPSIGEVRGLGLFWAVDLVKNRKTKEPLNTKADKLSGKPHGSGSDGGGNDEELEWRCKPGSVTWSSRPALIIEKEDIDFGVAALDHALALADQQAEA